MKCIECGHELKDGAVFCIRCGAMQVSMDGRPLESKQNWPDIDAQADGSGFRSSTDGALHSAQSKNPKGFKPAPQRGGGRVVAIVIAIIVLIAIIAFAVTQCMGPATSGSNSAASTATTTTSSEASSTTSSTSSASASTSSASAASTSSASASAAASSASSAAGSTSQTTSSTTTETQQQTYVEPEPEPEYYNYYVLPDSSSYYYSWDELDGMGTYDLYLARNEIYARHGRMFKRSDLQDYFNSQDWYNPVYTPEEFDRIGDANILSDVELQNAKLMRQVEAAKGSPYL